MLGFVEELVVFKRNEKEAENLLVIHKKYLKLRRKLGSTVRKRGGNAIVSYRQILDNEGDTSQMIVLRGYGTAALLRLENDPAISGSMHLKKPAMIKGVHSGHIGKARQNPYLEESNPLQIPLPIEEKQRVQFITSQRYPID